MVTRRFTVALEAAEEGGYIVRCLELPVASQGETKEEALKKHQRGHRRLFGG
jgi:predicted RNase H-like HicB family nuclease